MEEEILIVNAITRNQKIKNFITKNKNKIYFLISILLILIFSLFFYQDLKDKNFSKIEDRYISTSINFEIENKDFFIEEFKKIIFTNNPTYAPLSLFFLIDGKILESKEEINLLFNQILNNSKLDEETNNLLVYKKALFNSDVIRENELIEILKPIINSESIWKSHSLLLLGDYFISKKEKEKAKDFYIKILNDEKSSQNIKYQTQLRIRRNFSE